MSKQNIFNSVKVKRPSTSLFDLSHDVKLSANMGYLIPTLALECLPGDKHKLGCDSLLRFAPTVAPPMHKFHVSMHYFFVPNRILWPGWEKYITGDTSTGVRVLPYVDIDLSNENLLTDYVGIPPINTAGAVDPERVSALPFAAYQKIWNDYYRDQNLIAEWPSALSGLPDGDNTVTADLLTLRNRAWEHDYFTSALPFAQKGAGISVPILGFTDVEVFRNESLPPGTPNIWNYLTPAGLPQEIENQAADPAIPVDRLFADTSSMTASSTTINDLRLAFRLQEFLELNARGGTRYIENLRAHFGVTSSDKRLNRPEYIVGTRSPVMVSEVLSTVENTAAGLPQGNMSGHGVSVTTGKYGRYYCEEHGWIIGIMSIMPEPAYMQGIHRSLRKVNDMYEFGWPLLANLGEQAIQNSEIYAFQATGTQSQTFGYIPRYAEYKFMASRACGDFRTSLDFWHAARKFATPPTLSQQFIEMYSTEVDRLFAVTTPAVQKLYVHILHTIRSVRKLPKYGTPIT